MMNVENISFVLQQRFIVFSLWIRLVEGNSESKIHSLGHSYWANVLA